MVERKRVVPQTPAQAGDKYIVRFPEGMRERIAEAAKASNRSMNAEIIERLDRSFSPGETFATKEQVERLFKVVTAQHDTVRMLGSALQSVSEAPVLGRTPFGEAVAQRFAKVGGLFADGNIGDAHKAFAELNETVREWAETPEGIKALEEDRARFSKERKSHSRESDSDKFNSPEGKGAIEHPQKSTRAPSE